MCEGVSDRINRRHLRHDSCLKIGTNQSPERERRCSVHGLYPHGGTTRPSPQFRMGTDGSCFIGFSHHSSKNTAAQGKSRSFPRQFVSTEIEIDNSGFARVGGIRPRGAVVLGTPSFKTSAGVTVSAPVSEAL
jgi:hypothetical protein